MQKIAQRIDTQLPVVLCMVILLAITGAWPADADVQLAVAQDSDQKSSEDAAPAADVVLPDNPSREEVEKYFNSLHYDSSTSRSTYRKKLDVIPTEHLDLLLAKMANGWYADLIDPVMAKRDPKVYKPIVIAGLDEHPSNIVAIRHHGWYEDAKEPIRRKLHQFETLRGVDYAVAWLHAFIHVAEPEDYPKVKQMFVSSADRSQLVLMLEIMPGYDIQDTIRACIAATEQEIAVGIAKREYITNEYRELEILWLLLARGGDLDALDKLIDELNDPYEYYPLWRYRTHKIDIHRSYVTQLINFKGSNKAIAEWFEANRDELVFDPVSKRFVVRETS